MSFDSEKVFLLLTGNSFHVCLEDNVLPVTKVGKRHNNHPPEFSNLYYCAYITWDNKVSDDVTYWRVEINIVSVNIRKPWQFFHRTHSSQSFRSWSKSSAHDSSWLWRIFCPQSTENSIEKRWWLLHKIFLFHYERVEYKSKIYQNSLEKQSKNVSCVTVQTMFECQCWITDNENVKARGMEYCEGNFSCDNVARSVFVSAGKSGERSMLSRYTNSAFPSYLIHSLIDVISVCTRKAFNTSATKLSSTVDLHGRSFKCWLSRKVLLLSTFS